MTPRQLKYFVTIARTGSITTAASTLHIAQPALSHHIAAMEEEMGVPLLERHARGVRPTAQGQRLLERATAILRQMDRLRDDVRDASTQPRGNVSVCIVGSVAPVLTAPLFRLLSERMPEVRLQLSTGMSREAQSLVEARSVELALLPTAHDIPRLQAIPVFQESFCLFGRPELIGEQATPIAFAEIGDRPLVAPDRAHDLRRMVERAALDQNCTLNIRYELNNSELLRRVVAEGLACAVMSRNAFADPVAAGVVAREITQPALERTQSLVWMADQALSPAAEAVRTTLLELIDQLIGTGRLQARRLG